MTALGTTFTLTNNLGDEIQQVALLETLASLHLQPEFEVNRDTLQPRGPVPKGAKLIVAGWLSERRQTIERIAPGLTARYAHLGRFDRRVYLDPQQLDDANARVLYIGVHVNGDLAHDLRSDSRLRAHFLRHAPIGARDHETARRLGELGIPAFFSGCMTLQLERPVEDKRIRRLFIDVEPDLLDDDDVVVSQELASSFDDAPDAVEARRDLARERIALYAHSERVITNRLHAYLPCLALGSRVTFADPDWVSACDRFSGLLRLTTSRIAELRAFQRTRISSFLAHGSRLQRHTRPSPVGYPRTQSSRDHAR